MDSPSRHARTDSSDTTSSNGSSYQLILDHILTYPASYEIPLRTMYQLNCAPRGSPSQMRSGTPSSSAGSSPITPQGTFPDTSSTQTFTESLMQQIQQLPNQPKDLPPSFITHFLQRCFPGRLTEVDFPQALTGLDYLKDLETRRRREVASCMARLEIDREALDVDADSFATKQPGVAYWVKSIEEKERKIDALYTQLYIGFRRWILINELSLLPFNKHNCVAMLNTLYPPVMSTQPTAKLTRQVLKNQRDGFFKYIQSVEKNGSHVLRTLMQQGKAPTDVNGWPAVTRTLGLYLQLATSMIKSCAEILDVQSVLQLTAPSSVKPPTRSSRKADSGVSFNSLDLPSPREASIPEPAFPTEPLPHPTASPVSATFPSQPGPKHPSALEKLARGLKTIGRSRTDATEMVSTHTSFPNIPAASAQQQGTPKPKSLRKMRSMGALEGKKKAPVKDVTGYDVQEMRGARERWEASAAVTAGGRSGSHEV